MSGPKVVTLVTYEEMVAICQAQLAAFDAAVQELLAGAEKLGAVEELAALREELGRRRQELGRLVDAGRLEEMNKLAISTRVFLGSEAQRLEARAAAAALSLRERRRRLADAARGLAKTLPAGGELEEIARQALRASREELAGLEQKLRSLCVAESPQPETTSAEQAELAARLSEGLRGMRLEEWLAEAPLTLSVRQQQIDKALAELEACGGEEKARAFALRAEALENESDSRQALLSDSLLLDIGGELRLTRLAAARRGKLSEVQASLRAVGGAAALTLVERIEAALTASEGQAIEIEALLAEAEKALAETLEHVAAKARTSAMLKGLASLGYEVREDMSTALVRDGRIVVRKRGAADYGVEIGSPAASQRLQMRVVASDRPAQERSAARDRDQEVMWCGEVDKLKELLEASGSQLEIEKGLAPGVAPLKVVALGNAVAEKESRVAALPKERRLPSS